MKHEFTSELTPREILGRIEAEARPMTKNWIYAGNALFYQIRDPEHFLLIKTGGLGGGAGQTPFWAELTLEDGRTVIRGRFRNDKRILLPPLLGFLLIYTIFTLFGGGRFALMMFLPFLTLTLLLSYGIFFGLAPRLWRKRQTAVLSFIETRLLK